MKRFVIALALAGLAVAGCGEQKPAAPAPAAEKRDPLSVTAEQALLQRLRVGEPVMAQVRTLLQVPGRVEADETRLARVGSPVTGRINSLEVLEGDTVKRGQVLATLTSTELSATQLSFLKNLSAQALAQREATRARQLFEADVIGRAELERREAALVQAQADISAARDQLKVLGMSEAAIGRLAERRQVDSSAQIVASINGTVIDRTVTQGQVVQPADTVYVLADLSSVWLVADLPEQSAGHIQIGKTVEAVVAALPERSIKGVLSFVSATVDRETRTVRVRMDVLNPERLLKPAMLATVTIEGKPESQLVVPMSAVVREENRDYVFVQTAPDRFVLRQVALGAEYQGQRVLVGGLRDGEKIVVDGAFHLNNERKRLALQGG